MFDNIAKSLSVFTIFIALSFLTGSTVSRASGTADDPLSETPFGVYMFKSNNHIAGGENLSHIGVQWGSIFLRWDEIETSPGVYNWTQTDHILADSSRLGFNTIVTIIGNPDWAAETHCGPIYEEHLPDFARFLTAVTQRYSVPPYNIRYWALYNEPDNANAAPQYADWLGGCWGAHHPNALSDAGGAAYAHMLSYAYPAIKAGNPQAQVLLGGLAYDYFATIDRDGFFDPSFLDDLLIAGGGQYFDIINFHYFPWFSWRWKDDSNGIDIYNRSIVFKSRYIRNEVKRYIGETKPIICTETGIGSADREGNDVSELQANYVIKAMVRGMYAGLRANIWFEGVDETWIPGGALMRSMGLLTADGAPKPSYYAYQTLVHELSGARFIHVRDDLDAGYEGYVFETSGWQKTVLWRSEAGESTVSFPVPSPRGFVHIVAPDGTRMNVFDGSAADIDGQENGFVKVEVSETPRFYDVYRQVYTVHYPIQFY